MSFPLLSSTLLWLTIKLHLYSIVSLYLHNDKPRGQAKSALLHFNKLHAGGSNPWDTKRKTLKNNYKHSLHHWTFRNYVSWMCKITTRTISGNIGDYSLKAEDDAEQQRLRGIENARALFQLPTQLVCTPIIYSQSVSQSGQPSISRSI